MEKSERWIASEMSIWMNDILLWVPNWKWLVLFIVIAVGILIRSLLKQFFNYLKKSPQVRAKAHGFLLYMLDTDLHGPLAWVVTSFFWLISLDSLALTPGLSKYLNFLVQLNLSFHLIRLAYKAVDAFGKMLGDITAKTENTLDDQLAPFATKMLKIFVVGFGILIVVQNFGVNVMSLLAGLGLGGLALALAAQDTAANLFGSITIIVDRPFQVGDWIKVAGTEGIVEEIGFRSTRIRTMYKSLVTIPNSIMAKEQIDNMGLRPLHRIRHVLGLTYDCSEHQMKQFMDRIRYNLTQHPDVDKDSITVTFNGLGDYSLQILVNFFVQVDEVSRELEIQQEVLFEIMTIANGLGVEFAFPTATHHIRIPQPPPPAEVRN